MHGFKCPDAIISRIAGSRTWKKVKESARPASVQYLSPFMPQQERIPAYFNDEDLTASNFLLYEGSSMVQEAFPETVYTSPYMPPGVGSPGRGWNVAAMRNIPDEHLWEGTADIVQASLRSLSLSEQQQQRPEFQRFQHDVRFRLNMNTYDTESSLPASLSSSGDRHDDTDEKHGDHDAQENASAQQAGDEWQVVGARGKVPSPISAQSESQSVGFQASYTDMVQARKANPLRVGGRALSSPVPPWIQALVDHSIIQNSHKRGGRGFMVDLGAQKLSDNDLCVLGPVLAARISALVYEKQVRSRVLTYSAHSV